MQSFITSDRQMRTWAVSTALSMAFALAGCGGGGGTSASAGTTGPAATGSASGTVDSAAPASAPVQPVATTAPLTALGAFRLADQATFGSTEALVASIRSAGAAPWIAAQLQASGSHYSSGNGDDIHKNTSKITFCGLAAHTGDNCWRDWYSSIPLVWDFYRNALGGSDQLRQRVAFALQQIVVVSSTEVVGTYGLRNYQNALLDNAFGNYRQVLKKVALSPVMGDFLNNVNNDQSAPNENFARELLQLFSLGTCLLNADGSLQGGSCSPTYDNDMVRSYAYALTGWTYPAGGSSPYGCWPKGANCTYYGGDMVAVEAFHDQAARTLLGGSTVAAASSTAAALETVLDSLMAHPNMAPFIARQLIQKLVTSNPTAAQIGRAAAAFRTGTFTSAGLTFGSGQRGDLAATVAAVLLDPEARSDAPAHDAGKLREPALLFAGVLRGLGGHTDGDALSYWWGDTLQQRVFNAPSVFNFYAPGFPVAGTALVGPEFGIHNANAALNRLNYLTYLLQWGGSQPSTSVPNAVGTGVDLSAYTTDAADAGALVDRLSMLASGRTLSAAARAAAVTAVSMWSVSTDKDHWQADRVKTAAYLVYAAPQYQIQH